MTTRQLKREPRPEKVQAVEELAEKLSQATAFYLADFTGIKVHQSAQLRKRLTQAHASFSVVKNNILRRALAKLGYDSLAESIQGPNALMYTQGDEVEPVRIFSEFAAEAGAGSLKMGLIEGNVLEKEDVERLAKLPSAQELRGKVVGAMSAPLYALVGGLNGLLTKTVLLVAALRDQREKEAS